MLSSAVIYNQNRILALGAFIVDSEDKYFFISSKAHFCSNPQVKSALFLKRRTNVPRQVENKPPQVIYLHKDFCMSFLLCGGLTF
jgi:hypothetical protein